MKNAKIKPHLTRLIGLTLLVITLSSCGFHLRGHIPLSAELSHIYVVTPDQNAGFRNRLLIALKGAGSSIANKQSEATSILKVGPVQDSRRLISVNRLAQGRDYSLFKRVKFSLQKVVAGKVIENLIENRMVEVRRDLVKNPDDALGNDQQEEELLPELEQALIHSLLLQLRLN